MTEAPPLWLRASSRLIRGAVHVKRLRAPSLPSPGDVLGAQRIDLSTSAHPHLGAWWLPTEARPRPAVLLVHGFGAGATHMVTIAEGMRALGLPTLLVDDAAIPGPPRRGATGPPPRPGASLAYAVDWALSQPAVDGLVLIGHSMGASAALGLAAERDDVRAIVTMGAIADPAETPMAGIPAALNRRAVAVMRRRTGMDLRTLVGAGVVSRVRAPVLVVHGTADRTVPPFNADVLVAAGRTTERLLLPGVAHRPHHLYAAGRDRIDAFLRRHTATG